MIFFPVSPRAYEGERDGHVPSLGSPDFSHDAQMAAAAVIATAVKVVRKPRTPLLYRLIRIPKLGTHQILQKEIRTDTH